MDCTTSILDFLRLEDFQHVLKIPKQPITDQPTKQLNRKKKDIYTSRYQTAHYTTTYSGKARGRMKYGYEEFIRKTKIKAQSARGCVWESKRENKSERRFFRDAFLWAMHNQHDPPQ